ncbi:hypothetical protein R3P38DRAFT_2952519 [Favolaschia claudopus]|uniref:F-box domain-containing protein n=1 Tax=Favolaschia claudopus TaxID=2862362 RepID=A0AAW0BHJ7_9AGAR
MGVPAIPPELWEAIIHEIEDKESLMACSLVALVLRYPSQRILLSSLTVTVSNCASACKLLSASPHVAQYLSRLTIESLHDVDVDEVYHDNLHQLLANLQNIRVCIMRGLWYPSWSPHHKFRFPERSIIPPLLSDFLGRQTLNELHLSDLVVSQMVLESFMETVPTVSLCMVYLEGPKVPPTTTFISASRPAAVKSLTIVSGNVGGFLQQLSVRFPLVRHLSIQHRESDPAWVRNLIEGVSRTIEHLQFDCPSYTSCRPPPTLPYLPALRKLQFSFPDGIMASATEGYISAATATLSSIAPPQTTPALTDIVIKEWVDRRRIDMSLYSPFMSTLELSFTSRDAPPRIHWFFCAF